MSSTKFSVVTSFPRSFNHFPPSSHQLASSSLVDSPEACNPLEGEELEGLVLVPGSESDFQIKDIPIVTALDGAETDAPNMLYIKPMSPSVPPSQEYYSTYLTSACSSPDTSSMEAACPPTTRDFDHMYARYELVNMDQYFLPLWVFQLVTRGHHRLDGRKRPPEGDAGDPTGLDPAAGEKNRVVIM